MKSATAAIVLSGLALGACFTAHASEPQSSAPAEQSASNDMVVGIDAKTGKIRPLTAAETKALQAKAAAMPSNRALGARSKTPLTAADARKTMRKQATGGMAMRVPESAMSSMTATQDANGQLHFSESPDQPVQAKQEVTE